MIWRAILTPLIRLAAGVIALAASWFGGRNAARADIKAQIATARLKATEAAHEVENEVEALDVDALKRRAAVWVRKAER